MKRFLRKIDNYLGSILLFVIIVSLVFIAVIVANIIALKSVIYVFVSTGRFISFDEKFEKEKREIIDGFVDIIARRLKEKLQSRSSSKLVESKEINRLWSSSLLNLTNFLYSSKTQKEVFEPIIADWQEEYFEALFKKEIWKSRWINVRYTYAFLVAMWQKSPIGDLIQFVIKIAKP